MNADLQNPVCILPKRVLSGLRQSCQGYSENVLSLERFVKSGRIIGTFECMLVGVLMLLDEFDAIALVMTVKIVARYEHRKDDKGSAEIFS